MRRVLRAALPLVLWAASAWAGSPDLRLAVQVEREVRRVDARGNEQLALEPVETARPGDTLVYTLDYRNAGDAPASNAVLANPIPVGTVLVRGSAAAPRADVRYSLDGKSWSAWPRLREAGMAAGDREIDAPAAAVRHVQIVLREPVPAGGAGRASFKVTVQ